MPDVTYQPKVYREQGGSRQVVASGGSLDVESGGELDIESGGSLKLAGTAITATAAELNALADVSGRIVTSAATTISITAASHADRILVLSSTHTQTATLQTSTGGGDKYTIIVSTVGTDGSKIIKVGSTLDVIRGHSHLAHTDAAQVNGFIATATDDTITLNNTTSGGLVGDVIVITDVASGVYVAKILGAATGTVVTPFSATV